MPYTEEIIQKYLSTLSPLEKIACEIAKKDLASSFNIEKSIGFLKWINKNKL